MTKMNSRCLAAACATLMFSFCSAVVSAEERPYTEGSEITV